MLLNAEDTTKVSSYTDTINDQMNKSAINTPEAKAPESNQKIGQRQDEKNAEQIKWSNLSDDEKQKIEDERTAKRNEGLELINKNIADLDNQTQQLNDNKSGLSRERFDQQQTMINKKQACLSEMKTKLESAPVGTNVNLKAPLPEEQEVSNSSVSRH
jgi:uncharacterized phage infection (PIP) family protein YhgE